MRFCLFVVLFLGCWAAQAAQTTPPQALRDTLLLKDPKGAHISEAYRYYTEPFDTLPSPERAEAAWRAGKFRPGPWHKTLNLGMLHQRVWMRLPVRNAESQRLRFLWSIFNFTDSASLYCRRQGETTFRRLGASSSWVPAAERPFPARSLSFPFELNANESAVLYLRVEQHAGGIYLPTYIETAEHFLAWEMNFPFERHWVLLLGFYLSCALFSLVLFVFLRDKLYVWYALYVSCLTLFLLMEDGLDALVLPVGVYRLAWTLGQYTWLLLGAACGVRILQLFVRLRAGWPRLHRAGNWLAGAAVVFALAYAALYPGAVRSAHTTGLELLNTGREVLLLAMLAYGWGALGCALSGRQRRLAIYYGLTYICFFTGSALFWLNHAGLTNFNLVQPNALAWGLVLELLILGALLMGRFRFTLRQNAQLRIRQLQQRNEEGNRLIAAQDAEREQLARELHDALGPNLAALHMAWQSQAVREALAAAPKAASIGHLTEEILGQLYTQVRQLSHALLPAEPGIHHRLISSVESLCEALNLNGTPRVLTCFDADLDLLPQGIQSAAYRIVAELVNNAVRHAEAKHVRVQLERHSHVLELCVEDDGRGFGHGEDTPVTGIGLRGVRTRAAYLGGSVRIEKPATGTRIVVQLPC
ncbi:MAG: hypothetical protein JWR44_3565 [Hymenobacter sp.]|jgi:signal transduction histidine kinase|nr:hypothetical protein [Hymenobacter sp.]